MFKSLLNTHKFLLLSLIAFVLATYLDHRQNLTTDYNIDVEKFENILHQKEHYCLNIADSISKIIEHNTDDSLNFLTFPMFSQQNVDKLFNQGLSVIVYKNDTLNFWTDNLFEVSKVFNPSQFTGECVFVSNYWIDYQLITAENYKIIVAYRLKAEYPMKNKYLDDAFSKELSVPSNFKISLIPLSYGIDITDADKDYIFSIIPQNRVFTSLPFEDVIGILFILTFLLLFLYFNSLIEPLYERRNKFKNIWISLFLIFIVRLLQIKYKIPNIIYSNEMFDSQNFAYSAIFQSLGDLTINIFFILLMFYHFIKNIKLKLESKIFQNRKRIFIVILSFIATFVYLYSILLIQNLILNSKIPIGFINLQSLNFLTFYVIFDIVLVLFTGIYFLIGIIKIIFNLKESYKQYIYAIIGYLSAAITVYFWLKISVLQIIFLLIFSAVYLLFYSKNKNNSLYFYGSISFITALTVTFAIVSTVTMKQKQYYELLSINLTNQRDQVAEVLLNDIVPKLPDDQTLLAYAQNPSLNDLETETENYLRRRYFKAYMNKYNIDVTFCSDFLKEPDKQLLACEMKFTEDIQKYGVSIVDKKLYFVNSGSGTNYYVIMQPYSIDTTVLGEFFIKLTPKLYPSNIGYPELLLDEFVVENNLSNISYAKYSNENLVFKYGNYNYPLNCKHFCSDSDSVITEDKLNHAIHKISDGSYIVVTYNKLTFLNSLIFFSYFYLLFILLTLLAHIILNFKKIINVNELSFRIKLIMSLVSVLTMSLVLIGIINVWLNVRQYNQKFNTDVYQKLQQINISLQQILNDNHKTPVDSISYEIRQLSEVYNTDINLFDTNGFLITSSRPEIFQYDLIGKRIPHQVLLDIKLDKLPQFIVNEQIGKLKYSSAYSQFFNENEKLLFIINMPYFANPDALKKEVFNLIVSIINVYVVLFVLLLIISILISEQIIAPLIVLQNKFKKLELGKGYEKIEYKRKDEIGQLVDEYNKMVDKLHEYIDKLAKSERESAWRDMAKQIAHEIKNPLTPMKLSIQLLIRSWENQDQDFDKRLREVSSTLINQIETLRRIAEEFSDFAKMPKPQEDVFNLVNKIEEVCKLYENTENVEVFSHLHNFKEAFIFADEKQISRALINLIKNAIQAIPEGVQGRIVVDLDVFGDKAVVKIIDNGSGIPEELKDKLYVPSFTTKSSGMGLGLTMVKNIVDNARGKISFKSEVGKGTTFILEFPIYREENQDIEQESIS